MTGLDRAGGLVGWDVKAYFETSLGLLCTSDGARLSYGQKRDLHILVVLYEVNIGTETM